MEARLGQNDPKIAEYVEDLFQPLDPVLKDINSRALESGLPEIQVDPMDGLHIEVITRAMGAKKAVEIGTLAGYSGTCICRGMGPEGKLYTFELNDKNASISKESFKKAGFENNAEIIVGPALLNLPRISKLGPFDLVFIDADKEGYPSYLRWAIENLRIGGVILADNTFGWGDVVDSRYDKNPLEKPTITALRAFNKECAQSERLRSTIIPTTEGLTLAVKIK